MSGRDTVIEVRGLRSQFGKHVVHEDLDLEVRRGTLPRWRIAGGQIVAAA